jgi:hypothetical protein
MYSISAKHPVSQTISLPASVTIANAWPIGMTVLGGVHDWMRAVDHLETVEVVLVKEHAIYMLGEDDCNQLLGRVVSANGTPLPVSNMLTERGGVDISGM